MSFLRMLHSRFKSGHYRAQHDKRVACCSVNTHVVVRLSIKLGFPGPIAGCLLTYKLGRTLLQLGGSLDVLFVTRSVITREPNGCVMSILEDSSLAAFSEAESSEAEA